MRCFLSVMLIASFVLASSLVAHAGTRVEEVWRCELKDGKTQKDVHAGNSKWVKFVNAKVEGGDIHSYVATSIVGDATQFLYVDSFPDMKAWTAVKALMATDEGQALESALNEVATCSSNRLWSTTETMAQK